MLGVKDYKNSDIHQNPPKKWQDIFLLFSLHLLLLTRIRYISAVNCLNRSFIGTYSLNTVILHVQKTTTLYDEIRKKKKKIPMMVKIKEPPMMGKNTCWNQTLILNLAPIPLMLWKAENRESPSHSPRELPTFTNRSKWFTFKIYLVFLIDGLKKR